MATAGAWSSGADIGGRYEVLGYLGAGRSGEVYRAHDRNLDVEVALKLMTPQAGQAATWDEAQVLKRLESEYLLPVLNADIAVPGDIRYITMPLMTGGDIEKRTAKIGAAPAQAIRWAVQIANALERVHNEGLLHRDVKPGNVFLSRNDDALLADLGLAISIGSDGTAPANGTLVTAAPEALGLNGKCAVKTDIYSLAATTFFMLTGQYPVNNRGSDTDVYNRVIRGEKRKLRDLAPQVSQTVALAVERSLSTDTGQRASSALEFANQLSHARCHKRNWSRVIGHPGHLLCLQGGGLKYKRPVNICAIEASASKYDILVVIEGGRRVRRFCEQNLPYEQMLVALRRLAEKV